PGTRDGSGRRLREGRRRSSIKASSPSLHVDEHVADAPLEPAGLIDAHTDAAVVRIEGIPARYIARAGVTLARVDVGAGERPGLAGSAGARAADDVVRLPKQVVAEPEAALPAKADGLRI